MTKILVIKTNDRFEKIICEGHTGYGVQGEDIVCSAVSSIVQTAALGMLTVAAAPVSVIRDDEKAYFEIVIPGNLSQDVMHDVQVIFGTMLCGISDLAEEYSDFIELEVQNVY
ncbi:MAG: ribosomal-processing cysteine protease Prp [Clostridia bacterium]|nr:ribosomal-processing cysteine protease Prp [Clostridia bacterium]